MLPQASGRVIERRPRWDCPSPTFERKVFAKPRFRGGGIFSVISSKMYVATELTPVALVQGQTFIGYKLLK